jgi:hypothetical protein
MTYVNKLAALDAIMAEWGRSDLGYGARVNDLLGPSYGGLSSGLNHGNYLNPTTVHENNAADTLFGVSNGNSSLDWFLDGTGDSVKNKKSGEIVTTIM